MSAGANPSAGYLPSAAGDKPPRMWRWRERATAIDHAAVRVLVGLPRDRRLLVDARLRVVADTLREDLLKLRPLVVGERNRPVVVAAVQRLQLTLARVGANRVARDRARGPVDRHDRRAAEVVGNLVAVAVVAAVGRVGRLVADDLLGCRAR